MNNETKTSNEVVGSIVLLLFVLQIIFVILKLTETIDWSWWVVLIPLLTFAGFMGVLVVAGVVVGYRVVRSTRQKMDKMTK